MQKLQLYIGTERVELFKDETVSLTQTIQNVKDIKKIFTEFTKTFSVPASKSNNKIFKHYYNFNVQDGYDARTKTPASLELNGLQYKTGKITLKGVDLKNNLAHTYRVSFVGNTVNLKDILGDSQLSDLGDLNQYSQQYTFLDVKDKLYNSSIDGNILVPLITHTDRLTYNSAGGSTAGGNLYYGTSGAYVNNGVLWSQLKYAIKAQTIIDAIQVLYPDIVFSNDFFNNTSIEEFDSLFLWLHRKKGDVTSGSQDGAVWSQVDKLEQTYCFGFPDGCANNSSGSNGLLTILPLTGYTITATDLTLTPNDQNIVYSVRIINQVTGIVVQENDKQGTQIIYNGTPLQAGTYAIQVYSPVANFEVGITWRIDWSGNNSNNGNTGWTIYNYSLNAPTFFTTSINVQFNITEQIPKMKIIDFLTGLFQMFNLTAYVDEEGIIIIKPLDSYYASNANTSINIDQYLDTEKSTVDVALPFKSVKFSYKGLGTFLAKQYEQQWNTGWGSSSYTLDGLIYDAPSEDYEISLPFEHVMYERLYNQASVPVETAIQYGWFADDNQEPYFGSPLLFYPIRITGTNVAVQSGNSSVAGLASYYIPSNTIEKDCNGSLFSIHFNSEVNEYNTSTCFTDTLFESKYKTYIQDVFNNSRRLTTVTAHLPYKIFSSIQLNDKIQLGQSDYKINSMTTDLTTGKTKFELLNTIL
tara:strand:- start:1019 stop:3106 length:2088 start_codon:yes stop_codon:yes gene_type:complete